MRLATGCASFGAPPAPSAPVAPDFLGERGPRAQLLLLGTFHFQDAGRDAYKPRFFVDVLSPERQREIEDVVDRLAHFRPTKVAVEQMPDQQARLDSLYQAYRAGRFQLRANEVFQIGFRLAAWMGHDRVYAVDADGRMYEPLRTQEEWDAGTCDLPPEDTTWAARYRALYRFADSLKTVQPLRDHLVYLNSAARVSQSHGHYLVDHFGRSRGDDLFGPDWLTRWYNRNLRIFHHLRQITSGPEDRVLFVVGSGHLPILRHAAQSSPEYRLVEVAKVLGGG